VDNSFATVDDPTPKPQFNYSDVYSTNMYSGWTLDIIDQHDPSTPLFMYLPFEAVHGAASCEPSCYDPSGDLLQAPDFFIDQQKQIPNTQRRTFAGMLGALDSAVANITALLKSRGMWEDTLLIVSTDNGAPSGHFNSEAMSNWPLRGAKGQLWEGGVRGAGFVGGGWAGINPAMRGKNVSAMIHVADWLPTLANIVGGKAMGGPGTGIPELVTADKAPYPGWVGNGTYAIDGYNVWDTINNGAPSPRSVILHNIDPIGKHSAVRMGDFKLLVGMGPGAWYPDPDNADDVRRYQLARRTSLADSPYLASDAFVPQEGPLQDQQVYLFNIRSDPYERVNLAQSDPGTVAKLTAELARFPGVPCRYPNPDPDANPTLPGRTGAWAPWRNDSALEAGTAGAAEYRYRPFD
jgi:arylsulfatase B/arylsulfatase I/J